MCCNDLPTVGRLVPGALTDNFCDNGFFLFELDMIRGVFVFLTYVWLKVTCVFISLSTDKVFPLQVYSWHLYNTNYKPIIPYIQHWLIFHKLRVIGDVDGPTPTQPLSRVNEKWTHSGGNSQQSPAVDTVKNYHTLILIGDMQHYYHARYPTDDWHLAYMFSLVCFRRNVPGRRVSSFC